MMLKLRQGLRRVILVWSALLWRGGCALPSVAVVSMVVLVVAPETAAAATLVQQFQRAQKAFKDDNLKAAQKILVVLVRKYPDFEPAKALLGRVYFRAAKLDKAYKYFKSISNDAVTPDLAYEFGVTMFTKKVYKRAVVG